MQLPPETMAHLRVLAENKQVSIEGLVTSWIQEYALSSSTKPTSLISELGLALDEFTEGVDTGIIVCDNDYRIGTVNQKALQILGLSQAQVLGHDALTEIIVSRDGQGQTISLAHILKAHLNQPFYQKNTVEFHYFREQDQQWLCLDITIWSRNEGNRHYNIMTLHDISATKLSERSLNEHELRLKIISEMMSDYSAAYHVNLNGSLEMIWVTGQSYTQITGYAPDEAVVKDGGITIVHPADQSYVRARLKRLLQMAHTSTDHYRIITKQGHIRYIEAIARSVANEDGRITKLYMGVRDVTSRTVAEQALNKANTLLHKRVVEQTTLVQEINKRLQDSQARLLAIIETAADAIVGLNYLKKVVLFNSAAHQLFGYTPEEMFGQPLNVLLPEEILRTLDNTVSTQNPMLLTNAKHKDGSILPVQVSVGKSLDNHETFYTVVVRDFTLQKEYEDRLQNEHNLLQSIAQASPAGIIVIEHDGSISFANRRALEIAGLPLDKAIGAQHMNDMWETYDLDGNLMLIDDYPFIKALRTGQEYYDYQFVLKTVNRDSMVISSNASIIRDTEGNVKRVVFTIDDITIRKSTEKALVKALEKERELNELKTRFLSMVSHEFRSPLTVIMTSTGLVRMRGAALDVEQLKDRMDRIDSQVLRLDSLLTEVSTFNKTSTTGHYFHSTQINMRTFLTNIIEEVEFNFPHEAPISFIMESSLNQFFADENLLHHIFTNLISNAVKYSPGGQVSVAIKLQEDLLEAVVTDNGIGIPEKDRDHLYEFFHRGSNVHEIKGTGLGLAITKQCIDLHRGTIDFESEVGQGTTFTIKIPNTVNRALL